MADDITEANFLTFFDFPFKVLSLNEHDNGWSQVEVAKLISLLKACSRSNNNSSNIQGANHNHVEVALLPSSFHTESCIFFINFFPFDEGFLTDTVQSTFDSFCFFNCELGWSVEPVIIAWSQVKNNLIELVLAVFLQFLDLLPCVADLFAFNQLAQWVFSSLDDWALVFVDFRDLEDLTVCGTDYLCRIVVYIPRLYFSGEKCAERFKGVKRLHNFIENDTILFGIKCEKLLPEEFRNFNFTYLLSSLWHLNCDLFRLGHHVVQKFNDKQEWGEESLCRLFGEPEEGFPVDSLGYGSPYQTDVPDDVHRILF